MKQNGEKWNPLIPLMNEGLGELMCRRHFLVLGNFSETSYRTKKQQIYMILQQIKMITFILKFYKMNLPNGTKGERNDM